MPYRGTYATGLVRPAAPAGAAIGATSANRAGRKTLLCRMWGHSAWQTRLCPAKAWKRNQALPVSARPCDAGVAMMPRRWFKPFRVWLGVEDFPGVLISQRVDGFLPSLDLLEPGTTRLHQSTPCPRRASARSRHEHRFSVSMQDSSRRHELPRNPGPVRRAGDDPAGLAATCCVPAPVAAMRRYLASGSAGLNI